MEIGFVIVSHQNPGMLKRLVSRLSYSFGDPPIVCHHDSRRAAIQGGLFPPNVRFVREPIPTKWADISVVRACLLALRQLYDWRSPDWFIYLSGSDYPIQSGDAIRSELLNSPYDGYLDFRRIEYQDLAELRHDGDFHLGFRRPFFVRLAYDRYVTGRIPCPWVNRKGKWRTRHLRIRHPWLLWANPYRDGKACFAGDAWMTARARCANLLLSSDRQIAKLLRFFSKRFAPDESFFHTVLCNAPGLNLCNDNRRYEDWHLGLPNPRVLGVEDLEALLGSGQHFARKFSDLHDAEVLNQLDRLT